jgi:alpha-mannosidase
VAKTVLLVPHNHFDPTWRRCFDRLAVYNGVTVRGYTEVEDQICSAWLAMAPAGYTFTEGQTSVWRAYLKRRPETAETLRRLTKSGQLCCVLAGETVQDTNLPAAEGLVRNFLAAAPFYRDFCDDDHQGLRMAWLEDAFGTTPNYPQILRGVGAEIACMTSYRQCPEDIWVGIDGTRIRCYDQLPVHGHIGCVGAQPPCKACRGVGCAACLHTGMVIENTIDLVEARQTLQSALDAIGDLAVVTIGGEETMPHPGIPALVDELNRANSTRGAIRFATVADVADAHAIRLSAAMATRDDTPTPELNPAMPGTYVSRIANKQRTRNVSYLLVAAENAIANAAWATGSPVEQPADIAEAWRLAAFNQFHDAITGTHIDSANVELIEMLDRAEGIARKHLPTTADANPAGEVFRPLAGDAATLRLGNLDVTVDKTGIVSVSCDGKDVFGSLPYVRRRRDFRIAELVLESDYGDAWGQRIPSFVFGGENFGQVQLGDYNDSVEIAEGAIRWRGTYTGGDPHVAKLSWTVTVRASADGRRLDFTTEVDWDTRSKRLRVVIPVASHEDSATWETAFGFIDRRYDESQLDYSQWHGNTLDYPALHWVRRSVDAGSGVAVLNRGLPCHRWMPGRLDISVLRSPEWEFCAVEPCHYEFWDIDGQRDTGFHRLEYSIWPYTQPLSAGDLTRAGYGHNAPHCSPPPFKITGDVAVTAWKPAEDGSGWILRVHEAGGGETELSLGFAEPRTVTRTDLLERPQETGVKAARYSARLGKHQILTLHIR